MRVAWVVPGGVDCSGERRIIPALLWLMRRISRRVDLRVFSLRQESRRSRFVLSGVPVDNIGDTLTRVRAVALMVAAHRECGFDLVHAFWAGAPGEIAIAVGALIRRPVLVHVAGGELVNLPDIGYGGYRTQFGRARRRFVVRSADVVSAASHTVIDAVRRLGRRAERVPLGVGLEDWPPRPPRPRDPSRPARLVHVGSLNRVKDQLTMIRALARLAASGVRFHADVVGQDTLKGAVHRLAGESGIDSHVTFHGFLTQAELRPVLEAADLLVVSSRHEAGPVVLSEAAAVGVPTVGTGVGQIRDWAPEAAVTVRVADPVALADAIAAVLGNEERRLAIAAAAQNRARREDADWTAARFLALYADVREYGGPLA